MRQKVLCHILKKRLFQRLGGLIVAQIKSYFSSIFKANQRCIADLFFGFFAIFYILKEKCFLTEQDKRNPDAELIDDLRLFYGLKDADLFEFYCSTDKNNYFYFLDPSSFRISYYENGILLSEEVCEQDNILEVLYFLYTQEVWNTQFINYIASFSAKRNCFQLLFQIATVFGCFFKTQLFLVAFSKRNCFWLLFRMVTAFNYIEKLDLIIQKDGFGCPFFFFISFDIISYVIYMKCKQKR